MSWYDVLISVCTGVVTVSGAVAVLWKLLSKNIKEQSTELISVSVDEITKQFKKDLTDIKEKLDKQIQKSEEAGKHVDKAIMAIARDRINSAYEYYMKEQYIDSHAMSTLEAVYDSYTASGGNSFVTTQMEELRELHKRTELNNIHKMHNVD